MTWHKPRRSRGKVKDDDYDMKDLFSLTYSPPRVQTPAGLSFAVGVATTTEVDEADPADPDEVDVKRLVHTPIADSTVRLSPDKARRGVTNDGLADYEHEFNVVDCETEDHNEYFDRGG